MVKEGGKGMDRKKGSHYCSYGPDKWLKRGARVGVGRREVGALSYFDDCCGLGSVGEFLIFRSDDRTICSLERM